MVLYPLIFILSLIAMGMPSNKLSEVPESNLRSDSLAFFIFHPQRELGVHEEKLRNLQHYQRFENIILKALILFY